MVLVLSQALKVCKRSKVYPRAECRAVQLWKLVPELMVNPERADLMKIMVLILRSVMENGICVMMPVGLKNHREPIRRYMKMEKPITNFRKRNKLQRFYRKQKRFWKRTA